MNPPAWLLPSPVSGVNSPRSATIAHLLLRDGDKCSVCYGPLTGGIRDMTGLDIEIDHVVPRYHGGGFDLENLQLLHARCNNHKGRDWTEDQAITQVERNRYYYDVLLSRPDLIDPTCLKT